MATEASIQILERLLDTVTRAFSPEVARRLVEVRADAEVQRRMDELADKCGEETLTDEERSEYDTLIHFGTVIGLLQMKARELLAKNTAA